MQNSESLSARYESADVSSLQKQLLPWITAVMFSNLVAVLEEMLPFFSTIPFSGPSPPQTAVM
jgi:hypothetical protein